MRAACDHVVHPFRANLVVRHNVMEMRAFGCKGAEHVGRLEEWNDAAGADDAVALIAPRARWIAGMKRF